MARVAIIGAGNLGSFLAAHLKQAGHEVFFCVRHAPRLIRVQGAPASQFPYFFKHPPAADIVLLTVKAYDTAAAVAAWLPQLCKNQQPVAVIQNGIGHAERIAPYPAIPVLSYVYVEQQPQGDYKSFLPPGRSAFTVPALTAAEAFAGLFANTALQIDHEGAFHTAAWRKMLHNCVSNPLTALAGKGLEVLREPEYRQLAEGILYEGLQVALAEGAHVRTAEAAQILDTLAAYPAGTRTSMLQDMELGKRLEIEALNGALTALAREYDIPTPVNEQVIERIQQRQKPKAKAAVRQQGKF